MNPLEHPARLVQNGTGFIESGTIGAQNPGGLGLDRTALTKSPPRSVLDRTGSMQNRTIGIQSPGGFVLSRTGFTGRRINGVSRPGGLGWEGRGGVERAACFG